MVTILPVVSDLQVPLQDQRAVDALATFVADAGVDTVCVGDVLDAWQVSYWHKGLAGEFDGLFSNARDEAVKILKDLRVKDLSRSNHDDRLETYVAKYAPGLSSLPELRFEKFMRLSSIKCRFHRHPVEVAPDWLLMHGDEGSNISTPGGTAMNLARKTLKSIVCGHTHKMGLQHHTYSFGGKVTKTLWGFEVGHLMDMSKAGYLKGGVGNWQQGFGILVIDGDEVFPFPVQIKDGAFMWDGKRWRG